MAGSRGKKASEKAAGTPVGDSGAFLSMRFNWSDDAPRNADAEAGVLASILLDESNEFLNICVAEKVSEDYFFELPNKMIFAAMLSLQKESKPVDAITLVERMKSLGFFDRVDIDYIPEKILSRIESAANFRQWLAILRDKFYLRKISQACVKTLDMVRLNKGAVSELLNDVESTFLGINNDAAGDKMMPASAQIESALVKINELIASKGSINGVPTGFVALDTKLRGMHSNEMIVIAGRPGTGKTSIALNIVESAIFKEDPAPALVFSLEMLADQLYMRMIASRARVDQYKLGMGRLDKGKMEDIQTTAREIANAPLWIDDSESLTILEMRARARRLNQDLVRKGKHLGLIVVDYLQLLKPTDASTPREQAVGEISRGMKAMAKELKVPVIVLAQLNRDSEKDQRTPRASDLRESGSIEQDADVIILLSRQKTTDEAAERDCWPIRVDVVKQRNGPTGASTLLFNRSYTRYENYEKDETI